MGWFGDRAAPPVLALPLHGHLPVAPRTPLILGLGLTAGAVTALGLTLVASVRRRRRSTAMLRTLGFTGRQLRASVAWQSSIAVVIGLAVGVPLGIVVGRFLWDLFATNIYVVPSPTVPAPGDRARRSRCPGARQPGRLPPGTPGGPDAGGAAAADRVGISFGLALCRFLDEREDRCVF
jgi:hypothetical protein